MSQTTKEVWPGWKTGQILGTGSFGAVYEVERNGEKSAVKVISIPQSDSELEEMYADGLTRQSVANSYAQQRNSIMAEYSFMKELGDCPNVVRCDDARYEPHEDGIGWDIYIKMELLTPLTKLAVEDMAEEQVLKLGADLCKALELCRKAGILHRDIKPQNIFVSDAGEYKLGDFGIAKVTEGTAGGTKVGTYKYMAPEVYNNQPYGTAADIYSLGLVLYWLLNERRMPFVPLPPVVPTHSDEERAKMRRFTGAPLPAPLHGSEDLKQLVLKACAFNPKERYRSATQMRKDLESIMRGEQICLEVPVGEGTLDPAGERNVVHRQFCKNCGEPLFPNVHFCRKCGAELGVVPVVTEDVSEPTALKKLLGNKKLVLGCIAGCAVLVVLLVLLVLVPLIRYNNAVDMMDAGDYPGAIDAFTKLDDYSDSRDKITECQYRQAMSWFNGGRHQEAKAAFEALGGYADSLVMVSECQYAQAEQLLNAGEYASAQAAFEALGGYRDSVKKAEKCRLQPEYNAAMELYNQGKYPQATWAFAALGDFEDASQQKKNAEHAWRRSLAIVGTYYCHVEEPFDTVSHDGAYFITEEGKVITGAGYGDTAHTAIDPNKKAASIIANGYYTGDDDNLTVLYEDGTVSHPNFDAALMNNPEWHDIVKVSASLRNVLIGLRADGKLVTVRSYAYGEIQNPSEMAAWTDIVDFQVCYSAGNGLNAGLIVALKADGTFYVTQYSDNLAYASCNMGYAKRVLFQFSDVKDFDIFDDYPYYGRIVITALTNDGRLLVDSGDNFTEMDGKDIQAVVSPWYLLKKNGDLVNRNTNAVVLQDVVYAQRSNTHSLCAVKNDGSVYHVDYNGNASRVTRTGEKTKVFDEWG